MAEILGVIGPKNQYDSDIQCMNEEELKKTSLYSPNPNVIDYYIESNYINAVILPNYLNEIYFKTGYWSGSNAWAVHGNHTVTGKPQLGSDPHLEN